MNKKEIEFDIYNPIAMLPSNISLYFVDQADFMHFELSQYSLTVNLIVAPEKKHNGHKIRSIACSNPEWYRKLWEEYSYIRPKSRRVIKPSNSNIRKDRVFASLDRLRNKRDLPTNRRKGICYDSILRELIQHRLLYGFEEQYGGKISAKDEVRLFFGLEPLNSCKLEEMLSRNELLNRDELSNGDKLLDLNMHTNCKYGTNY